MLNVTRLRVLLAVARHGSVTAAAEALHYAQPSVSHHLARLESETGARLVQRVGRGVRLTPAGHLLAERAEEILGRLDAAEEELAALTGLTAGRVRLAAFPSALGSFVPIAAARFAAAHPDVALSLVEAEPPEALRLLKAGEVDLAVVFDYDDPADVTEAPTGDPPPTGRPGPLGEAPTSEPSHAGTASTGDAGHADDTPTGAAGPAGKRPVGGPGRVGEVPGPLGGPQAAPRDGVRLTPLFDEPLYLVTGQDETRDLPALAGARWIGGCERCRTSLVRRCAAAGFTPDIAFTTDDYVAVQALVAAGLGVTILPDLALRAHRATGVRAVRLPGPGRHISAALYGTPPDPPGPAALLEALLSSRTRT
ncbi:LysR substrate-binding domain-containing protein [Dactylosporangium sp. NPDC005555]|uniref:LysR family transcriptional regulator n=1 Tax=Dactylosporangium sp. NPDC005555 TaxID=3154889 RepID=UPI0033B04192